MPVREQDGQHNGQRRAAQNKEDQENPPAQAAFPLQVGLQPENEVVDWLSTFHLRLMQTRLAAFAWELKTGRLRLTQGILRAVHPPGKAPVLSVLVRNLKTVTVHFPPFLAI
jgi:hypothetical protein